MISSPFSSTPTPSSSSSPSALTKSTSSSDSKTGLVGLEGFKNSPTIFTTATGKEIGNVGYQARLYFELPNANGTHPHAKTFFGWARKHGTAYDVSDVEYHLYDEQDMNEKTCEVRILYKSRPKFDDMLNSFLENESWCKSLLAGCLLQQKEAPIDSVAFHTIQNGTVCTHPTEVLSWNWGYSSYSTPPKDLKENGKPQESKIKVETNLPHKREEDNVDVIDLTGSDAESDLTNDFDGSFDFSGTTSFDSFGTEDLFVTPVAKKQKKSH